MEARMSHTIMARLVLTLALIAAVTPQASAHDLWDTAFGWLKKCDGGYTCYGPPYGNTEPPDLYVYDHRTGPTWTGNGWAYLPVGRYRPRPPEYAEPPPPPPAYRDDDDGDEGPPHGARRHRPMK
jgi:hypothetical protein